MPDSNWRVFFETRLQKCLTSILIEINALCLVILSTGKKIEEEEKKTKDQQLKLLKDRDLNVDPYFWKYDGRTVEKLLRELEGDLSEKGNHSLYSKVSNFRDLYRESKFHFQFLNKLK